MGDDNYRFDQEEIANELNTWRNDLILSYKNTCYKCTRQFHWSECVNEDLICVTCKRFCCFGCAGVYNWIDGIRRPLYDLKTNMPIYKFNLHSSEKWYSQIGNFKCECSWRLVQFFGFKCVMHLNRDEALAISAPLLYNFVGKETEYECPYSLTNLKFNY